MNQHADSGSGLRLLPVLVLAGIAVLCVLMMLAGGAIKYRLDRAEVALAAPDSVFAADQELYDRTLTSLGYGGFLGSAQAFVALREKGALSEMKRQMQVAQGVMGRLAEKTPAAVRRDVQSILDVFGGVMARAEASVADPAAVSFTQADLFPALVALPVLDSRLQASLATNRMEAQDEFRTWSLALTVLLWLSLILAATMTAALYLGLRHRRAGPLKTLAQSVDNLAQGDLETPIWGIERRDPIGELARALDRARYFFARVPDLSVMTDQGPLRLRFEGGARSLFEALTQSLAKDHDTLRQGTVGLTTSLTAQRERLDCIVATLDTALKRIESQTEDEKASLRDLRQEIEATANALNDYHRESVLRFDEVLPNLQERARALSDMTQMAGTRVAESLEGILKAEQGLKVDAGQSRQAIAQIAGAANTLGERLFAAVNLVQATGKILEEASGDVRERLRESVENLGKGERHLENIIIRSEARLDATAQMESDLAGLATRAESASARLDSAIQAITERHDQLGEQVLIAAHRMDSIIGSFNAAERQMGESAQKFQRDSAVVGDLLRELREHNAAIAGTLEQARIGGKGMEDYARRFAENGQALMARLEDALAHQAHVADKRLETLAGHGETLAQQTQGVLAKLNDSLASMRQDHEAFLKTRANFLGGLEQIGSHLAQKADASFGKTEQWAAQSLGKIGLLNEQMDTVLQRLGILGQLTGTLGNVAGQLGQLVPALTAPAGSGADKSDPDQLAARLLEGLQARWTQMAGQMEGVKRDLAAALQQQKEDLAARLTVLEGIATHTHRDAPDSRQTAIMNDMVLALARMSDHVLQIEGALQDSRVRRA